MQIFTTPILFLIFNREDTAQRVVFETIILRAGTAQMDTEIPAPTAFTIA